MSDAIHDDKPGRISDHNNTWNPALRIIKSKGFQIFIYPVEGEGNYGSFWAIKNNRDFMADDPIKLLGIITMWENLGDDWGRPALENVLDTLMSNAFPNLADIEKLDQTEFDALVSDYRLFLTRIFPKDIIPIDVTREAFFSILDNWYKWDIENFYEWEAPK